MGIFPLQFNKSKSVSWIFLWNICFLLSILIGIGYYNYKNNKHIINILNKYLHRFNNNNNHNFHNLLKKINIIALDNGWTVEYETHLKSNPLNMVHIDEAIKKLNQYYFCKAIHHNGYITFVFSNIVDKEDIKKLIAILEDSYNKSKNFNTSTELS